MLDGCLHGPYRRLFQDVSLAFRSLRYLLSLVQLMVYQNKDWHLKFSITITGLAAFFCIFKEFLNSVPALELKHLQFHYFLMPLLCCFVECQKKLESIDTDLMKDLLIRRILMPDLVFEPDLPMLLLTYFVLLSFHLMMALLMIFDVILQKKIVAG
jgi:hypothetical protein